MAIEKKLNVLIVGCGNIAGNFDEKKDKQGLPYTHAGAYSQDGRFNLSACVEPDEQRKTEFCCYWQIEHGFSTIEQVLSSDNQFDVISICSPTDSHYADLKTAIQLQPKLIFCEKPLASNLELAKDIVDECEQKGILLAVNYTRSWDPYLHQLTERMASGDLGELRSVVGTYNKGILNNGSHLLDLLISLLGELNIAFVAKPITDFFPDDPTVPVFLETNRGVPVHLATANAQDYALFELQLIFSKAVLVMEEGGFKWRERHVEQSTTFTDYHYLDQGEFKNGAYEHAMLTAVDNIYQAISTNKPIVKTGKLALKVQALCEQIRQQSLLKKGQ